ncbi:MAG: flotillin-like FloA family protein, partial [Candidatus Eremiobacteraeota bacterium]|nr:flotillin-like FloA family protein [Candidatus Eremiobacteraeota bacterium]
MQLLFYFVPFPLWLSAVFSKVRVGLVELFVMRSFRKIPPHEIVLPAITANYAGLPISVAQLQTHYMAGGNIRNVVAALIAATKAG